MAKLSHKKKRQLMTGLRWGVGVAVVGGLIYGMVTVAQNVGEKEKDYDAFAESIADQKRGPRTQIGDVPVEARYVEALALVDEKKLDEARLILREIAPPRAEGVEPVGHVPAHLWLGLDLVRPAVVTDRSMLVRQSPILSTFRSNDLAAMAPELVQRARDHFRAADTLEPKQATGALWMAEIALARGRTGEAALVLMEAATRPQSPQAGVMIPLVHVARMLPEDGPVYQEWWHSFAIQGNETLQKPGDLDVRLDYAATALMLRKYDNCAVILQKMRTDFYDTRRYPGVHQAWDGMMMALEYSKALDAMGVGDDLEPDVKAAARHLCAALRYLPTEGTLVEVMGQFATENPEVRPAVTEAFAESVEAEGVSDAVFASVQRFLGEWAQDRGELEDAMKFFEEAADADPHNAVMLLSLARNARARGESEMAYELADQSVRLAKDPEVLLGEAYDLRGRLAFELEKWDVVIGDLEKALDRSVVPKELHSMLAAAYAKVGDEALSKRHSAMAE
ncbi:tetratricopeptide repeat protein [Sulfuriroseicoccus oceanibius]|uniref:Uncharacterized protein n=1 Tax=Sulfuriroseicoccus oceanibius TaxID=2707525 RepID=A0A6B3L7H6_9BACT|nr:hypothetical protein [Sulfuriroseicoccus oceanibius]QQL44302.1 hypothetical protein G3M56_010435 [Sulfuriroseicoccus oceanibius]